MPSIKLTQQYPFTSDTYRINGRMCRNMDINVFTTFASNAGIVNSANKYYH